MPYIQKKSGVLRVSGLDPDDLIQEGLIGLFSALKTYDEDRGTLFTSYARSCIDNRITSAWRQAARKKNIPLNEYLPLDEGEYETGEPMSSPEELAIAAEGYEMLTRRIEQMLSQFERNVLNLHMEGYDYKSVAIQLGTTVKSVDNALQRARNKLKSG